LLWKSTVDRYMVPLLELPLNGALNQRWYLTWNILRFLLDILSPDNINEEAALFLEDEGPSAKSSNASVLIDKKDIVLGSSPCWSLRALWLGIMCIKRNKCCIYERFHLMFCEKICVFCAI
jgi:hypothetical protein